MSLVPDCTCADWGMTSHLSTCPYEIYLKEKEKQMDSEQDLTPVKDESPVDITSKVKVRRLSMGQRFEVMNCLKDNVSLINAMSSNKEVADFVMEKCKVEMSAQTAANYLKELGIPSPGSSGDPILKAKVAQLEQRVESLTDKITEILQFVERQLGFNDNQIRINVDFAERITKLTNSQADKQPS